MAILTFMTVLMGGIAREQVGDPAHIIRVVRDHQEVERARQPGVAPAYLDAASRLAKSWLAKSIPST